LFAIFQIKGGSHPVSDNEQTNIYAIPASYTDSGKLFGGMLEVRNTIEAMYRVRGGLLVMVKDANLSSAEQEKIVSQISGRFTML